MAIASELLKVNQPEKLTGIFIAPMIAPANLREITSQNASNLANPYGDSTIRKFSEIAVFTNERDPRVGEKPLFDLSKMYPDIFTIKLTPGSGHSPNLDDESIGEFIELNC